MTTSPAARDEVVRCTEPGPDDFAERFGRPGLPVVLVGAADGWPARQRWTLDGLARRCPALPVTVTRAQGPAAVTRSTTLGAYVDYLARDADGDATPWYLASWRFSHDLPELLDDFEIPRWFRENWLVEVDAAVRPTLLWMFIGPPGTGSWLHLDVAHSSAWNVQISGRKRWILFPPGQDDRLYGGRVNAFAPDLERFPRFAEATALVADVGPGDLIFTPTGWWHQTLNLETGIALTGNFANAWNWEAVAAWLEAHPLALAAQGLEGLAAAFRARALRP